MQIKKIIKLLITIVIIIVLIVILSKLEGEEIEENITEEIVEEIKTEEIPPNLASARDHMIEYDLKGRNITDKKVLDVMAKVPRHEFVPSHYKDKAYEDYALPISRGQTISQPYIVALMTQTLDIKPTDKVLEIGTGSGYQAAVLSELAKEVYTIEIIEALANGAKYDLDKLNYDNIKVKNADGYFGWEEYAPFDAIMITAAADHIPPPLIEQLKDNGKLIIPLGSTKYYQTLTLVTKQGEELKTKYISSVRFVPMIGEALNRSG
ncbi:protein-L-isoaspartate(D-aspartate) O-methyltransferase [Candidatus Woesearchaeota archaeon]|nr:protein-L-isoaspartate(D-aspartate) O-methyltransferase [Candidatus Woesearchaeota archaeon]